MTKKSKVFIVVFIAIILFSGLHIYKRQSENKPIDYKADFYSKTNDMFFALCNTEVYEYVNGNFISSASDITLTANLEKLDKVNNINFHDGDIYNYERNCIRKYFLTNFFIRYIIFNIITFKA